MSTRSMGDRQSIRGRVLRLATVAALIGGGLLVVSTAAVAEPAPGASTGAVSKGHTPPRAPFVVDGVRYKPEQISRFDGRELYFVVDIAKPDAMVGFTRKSDFDAAVARMRVRTTDGSVQPQLAGQSASLYSGDELTGDRIDIQSPWGINTLGGVNRGCGFFGCAGTWDNVASSVNLNGRMTVNDGGEYTGTWLYLQGTGWGNLSWWGMDNVVSSVNVWW